MLTITNEDNMALMARYPDRYFDLAIVDPHYGIDVDNRTDHGKKRSTKSASRSKEYENKGWDKSIPTDEYFNELFRVSKNQIIWGGNYYAHILPASSCWIVWDKENDGTKTADCEMAWTSFNTASRLFRWMWRGFLQDGKAEKKIHMCQKPVKLYQWIFDNYAKAGQKILDTHLGSASSAIAAHYSNMDFVGCEIDKDHYNDAIKRFKIETAQTKLF